MPCHRLWQVLANGLERIQEKVAAEEIVKEKVTHEQHCHCAIL